MEGGGAGLHDKDGWLHAVRISTAKQFSFLPFLLSLSRRAAVTPPHKTTMHFVLLVQLFSLFLKKGFLDFGKLMTPDK